MSWMKRLSDVYDNNIHKVGEFETRGEGSRFTLLPISHVTQSAQIEVLLDHEGQFYSARVVPKEEARTIVPATLDSANRSGSKIAGHFLHDKLFYVAADYMKYGGEQKRADNYKQFIEQLGDWATSELTHHKVTHIYNYIKQGNVIRDLVAANVLYANESGKLIEKWTSHEEKKYGIEKPDIYKVVTGDSSESFVRFAILKESPHDPPVWEDKELFQCFQHYLASKMNDSAAKGVCYITNEVVTLTEQHGSRLRNAGDMAKLISSNDARGFTYRGRFDEPNQAVQIGYNASQQAHNALRWLIQRQGHYEGSRYFVTFGVKDPAVIMPFQSTLEMLKEPLLGIDNIENDDLGFNLGLDSDTAVERDYTYQVIAEQVQRAFQGLKHNFELKGIDQIIVMVVDAATTGRLAIVYYQELDSLQFLDKLSHWHRTCKWIHTYIDDNKKVASYVGTPSTYLIVESIYGSQADDKVKKELFTRLLPCIVDRAAIPKDIVRAIFNRVRNPMSFKDDLLAPTGEWQRTLNIACALIHKQYEKEELKVSLDLNNHTRDYLFGRLIGVAEVLERNELNRRDEKRATNAARYFNAFSQHPARTWMTIRKQIQPYLVRQAENLSYYNRLIQEIESLIQASDMNNDALGPIFLPAYSSQVKELYTKKDKKEGDTHVNASEQD